MNLKSKISISGLQIPTIIGVYDFERVKTQELLIDIDIGIDISTAAKKDDLRNSVDYQYIRDLVVKFGKENKFKLIESFAFGLYSKLIKIKMIKTVSIKIIKPNALDSAKSVAVRIYS